MEPHCCLRRTLLVIAFTAICCFGVDRNLAAQDSDHFDVPLKDRFGGSISPESTEPYSPRKTCGTCHDIDHIANGYHFQQGRTDSSGQIIVKEDFFADGRKFIKSPGMYGKW